MIKFYRNLVRVWRAGFLKTLRMAHIFLPLSLFFAIIITCAGCFFFAYGAVKHLITDLENRLNIVVYLDRKLEQAQINEITGSIQALKEVSKIEFVSANEALAQFKEKHKDDALTMEALAQVGSNPFGPSIVVFAKNSSRYAQLATDIRAINNNYLDEKITKPITDISYERHKIAIEKFAKMLKQGEVIFAIVLILITLILLFVVYLAIRFATQTDEDEVKVMKLVGAPTMLIIGPTSIMGILSGILGAIIALFLLYFIAQEVTPYAAVFAGFNLLLWYISYIQHFILFAVGFGVLIGFFGSLIASRRHL